MGRPANREPNSSYQRIANLRVSTTDPDATLMHKKGGGGAHLGYHTLLLAWDEVIAQPSGEFTGVADHSLAEAKGIPNLGAMVLNRASRPVVPHVVFVRNPDLFGDVSDDGAGYLVAVLREAAFVVKV